MRTQQNPLGLVYIIVGLILFIWVAAAFLLKAIIAAGALALVAYGIRVFTGLPVLIAIRSWKNFQR